MITAKINQTRAIENTFPVIVARKADIDAGVPDPKIMLFTSENVATPLAGDSGIGISTGAWLGCYSSGNWVRVDSVTLTNG